jgi:hypothetical protein
MATLRRLLFVLAMGATLIFVGIRDIRVADASAEQETFSAEQLERGERPKSGWLKLTGYLLTDGQIKAGPEGLPSTYIPLVSEGWKSTQPLAGVVHVQAAQRLVEAPGAHGQLQRVSGMVDSATLPAPVIQLWRDQGVEAADALVLVLGKSPGDSRSTGVICAWLGAGVLGLCSLILLFVALRARHRAALLVR